MQQPPGLYGAPPPYQDSAGPMNQGYDQFGQPFNEFGNQANQAMQPYAGGAPMMPGQPFGAGAPNAPNAMVPPSDRSWMATVVICFLFGWLGAHRYYTRHYGTAVIQTITLGVCGIWTFIDFVMLLTDKFNDSSGRPLLKN
jgi:hypothetical protein